MRITLAVAAWVVAAAPGCALRATDRDPDVALYATAHETPRLEQQPMVLEFVPEGAINHSRLAHQALAALLGTGKFRLARPGEKPTVRITLTMRIDRTKHPGRALAGALLLYLLPVTTEELLCQVYADVRETTPPYKLIAHCYAQSRGETRAWIGNLFGGGPGRKSRRRAIERDALRAAAVKICRALMPRVER